MDQYPYRVKQKLRTILAQADQIAWMFSKAPKRDFSRHRKLPFHKLAETMIGMEGGTLSHEMLKGFHFSLQRLSVPAFIQQRAKIEGGIHRANTSPLKLLESIREVAAAQKAKGRRQYVRANCLAEDQHELMWNQENTAIKMKLVDISTSGVAVKVQQKFLPYIKENAKIHGATLRLGTRQFLIDFIVYGIHQRGPNTLMITLFNSDTVRVLHSDLQSYIYEILQKHIMDEMELLALDEKEYNKLGSKIKVPKITVDQKAAEKK